MIVTWGKLTNLPPCNQFSEPPKDKDTGLALLEVKQFDLTWDHIVLSEKFLIRCKKSSSKTVSKTYSQPITSTPKTNCYSPDKFTEITLDNLKEKYGSGILVDLSPGSSLRKKGTVQRGQVKIFPQSTKYDEGNMTLVVSCNRKWAKPDEIEIQRYALVASISHSDPQDETPD